MLARLLAALAAAALASASGHSKTWIDRYDPRPNPASVVTHGNARFTVLLPSVVRMEYAANKQFDDDASLAFLHRNLPTPEFSRSVSGSVLTLRTSNWELTYDASKDRGLFSSANLRISLLVEPFSEWTPAVEQTGNLHGTIRTLDRVGSAVDLKCVPPTTAMVYYTHCEEGFASRDGWVLVQDTLRPRFDGAQADKDWTWLKSAPPAGLKGDGSYIDLYFFCAWVWRRGAGV